MKGYTRRYRDSGLSAFIKPAARRVGHRLTPERLVEVQGLLDGGMDLTKVSQQTGMLVTTLRKAIQAGRLRDQKKALSPSPAAEASTKSERSASDAVTPLGVATERVEERVLASLGALGAAAIRMERADDVVHAGVLCALPALLELGLLRHTHTHFQLPPGYYPPHVIFLVIALLALARVPTPEDLRYEAPGEWGKILGLDRLSQVSRRGVGGGRICQPDRAVDQRGGSSNAAGRTGHAAE